ncbi:uncharacterized protein LOC111700009 [Eurytemora carolleeae]|uniref:uncharacterized protein LOC111700009 n=1 Tax=Eurytemora carolleeae TaxID=1294199 RepID=UPI000C781224|nr:uncharacterized protein LOC111700009 [Eurytemora carolleeae]|eukprot:XP_023326583.1 uncharacterized protein LOC111700009 [Eurytemora affinis]
MGGSTYSQDTIATEKQAAQRTSPILFNACVAGFTGGVLLLMSFCSPYWLQSWSDTASPFTNMGLWEVCFYRFRYLSIAPLFPCFPARYLTPLFSGINLPPFCFSQINLFRANGTTVSFMINNMSSSYLIFKYFRFEWQVVLASCVMKCLVAILIFIGICLFGGSCWDRGWLLYPNYNYVSWSYAFACFAMVAHGVAGFFMFREERAAKERRDRNMALVMQMYPTPGLFDGSISNYHELSMFLSQQLEASRPSLYRAVSSFNLRNSNQHFSPASTGALSVSQPVISVAISRSQPNISGVPTRSQPDISVVPTRSKPNISLVPTHSKPNISGVPTHSQPNISVVPTCSQPDISVVPTRSKPNISAVPTSIQPNISVIPAISKTTISVASVPNVPESQLGVVSLKNPGISGTRV